MIQLKDLSTKTRLELVKELIADYKKGNLAQICLINSLVKVSVLGTEKEQVKEVINNFVQDCLYEIEKDYSNSNAIYLYTLMLYFGFAGPKTWETVIDFCERAIQLGHPSAMSLRAYMYESGKGGPVDYNNAIILYEQAMAHDEPIATSARAYMHAYGKGGEIDFATAFILLKKVIDQGHPSGMCARAYMHEQGEGGAVNNKDAITLYDQAISLVSPLAMSHRASMHESGKGGPVDYNKAILLYEQAIILGHPVAMTNRASMYENAKGGAVNYKNAIILYDQAISLGDLTAMYNRAVMHKKANGGGIEYIKAGRLYRLAADKGLMKAHDALKKSNKKIFKYHYSMHGDYTGETARLVWINPSLLEEFITFDCSYLLENNKLSVIEDFAEKYTNRCDKNNSDKLFLAIITELLKNNRLNDIKSFSKRYQDKNRSNQVCYLILMALKSFKKELGHPSDESLDLEYYCLKQLDIGNLEEENLIPIIGLIADQWYVRSETWSAESMNYTEETAPILEKILYRIIACGKDNEGELQDLLINVAILIGKNKYGKKYRIFGEQWDLTVKDVLGLTLGYGKLTLETSLSTIQKNFENELKGLTTKLKQLSVQEADILYQSLRNASEVLFNQLTPDSNEKVVVYALQKFIQDSIPMVIASLFGQGLKNSKHGRADVKTFFTFNKTEEEDVIFNFKKDIKQLTEDLKDVIETRLSPATSTVLWCP